MFLLSSQLASVTFPLDIAVQCDQPRNSDVQLMLLLTPGGRIKLSHKVAVANSKKIWLVHFEMNVRQKIHVITFQGVSWLLTKFHLPKCFVCPLSQMDT